MESFGEFVLLFIQQFAGGPGPSENNLTRFGLASMLWLILLLVAWSRQRSEDLPREKLLVWGFALALIRELIMLGLTIRKIIIIEDLGGEDIYFHPLEHALEMAAVIVVAGAFLRYALPDERISRRYLQIGLSVTTLIMLVSFITWPEFAHANPSVGFNKTWESRLFHILSAVLILAAILILARKRDWLRSIVSVALGFLLVSELLLLLSYAMGNSCSYILCPIGNAFHIGAIPIFGFVYLNEMSIEKKKTEEKLDNYRNHLEDLVNERTTMLIAQNAIADSLSQSLDLETILNMALDKVLPVLSMEIGLIFLVDRERKELTLESYHGQLSQEDIEQCLREGCLYQKISKAAIDEEQIIIQSLPDGAPLKFTHIEREGIQSLTSAPLISKDHIVGTLTLGSKKFDPLSQTDLELLTAVCNQIAMAVENAYLFQEAERWAGELGMLHQASVNLRSTLDAKQIHREIVTQATRLTGCQIACVFYWNKKGETVEVLSSVGMKSEIEEFLSDNLNGSSLFDELSAAGKSIVIDDVAQDDRIPETWRGALDIHSLLCTPIWGGNGSVEFLFIMDQRKSKSWHSKDVELVESFVSRAAVALENANLHKQLEWAAALEERQRIAANIHDGLAQIINLVGLKVDQASELIPTESKETVLDELDSIRETVDRASVEVRKSIASLQNIPQPRKSLQEILTSFAEKRLIEDTFAFEVTLSFPEPLFLHPDHIAQVIPIVQEAIINAQKHSDATLIKIRGQKLDDLVSITIEDDGKGFDVDELISQDGNHFGLRIMRARAARFGGMLKIVSKPDYGTTIMLSWILALETDGEKKRIWRKLGLSELLVAEGESHV